MGLHPESLLVLEAMVNVELRRAQFELELTELRRTQLELEEVFLRLRLHVDRERRAAGLDEPASSSAGERAGQGGEPEEEPQRRSGPAARAAATRIDPMERFTRPGGRRQPESEPAESNAGEFVPAEP